MHETRVVEDAPVEEAMTDIRYHIFPSLFSLGFAKWRIRDTIDRKIP